MVRRYVGCFLIVAVKVCCGDTTYLQSEWYLYSLSRFLRARTVPYRCALVLQGIRMRKSRSYDEEPSTSAGYLTRKQLFRPGNVAYSTTCTQALSMYFALIIGSCNCGKYKSEWMLLVDDI